MEKTVKVNYNGTPFLWLIGLLFVGLKLTDYIDWSWWFVLLPFYLPLALIGAFILLMGAFVMIAGIIAVVIAFFEKK